MKTTITVELKSGKTVVMTIPEAEELLSALEETLGSREPERYLSSPFWVGTPTIPIPYEITCTRH